MKGICGMVCYVVKSAMCVISYDYVCNVILLCVVRYDMNICIDGMVCYMYKHDAI